MYDEVHVDEKWFFLCKAKESYILVCDEEEPPERYVKHKSHIAKVMFLCAQARPRYVHATGQYWDEKIGIWPIGKTVLAQRTSVNRPAGTPEWQNVNVDLDVYREMLLSHVVPAIIEKWPTTDWNNDSYSITIQQDGAPTHIAVNDDEWLETLEELGLPEDKIKLYTQPANSPDLNLNDLGFFNALQSYYYQRCPSNAMEPIDMVKECYNEYPANKINRIWLTLQSCLNEIIINHGGNQYKIPHMNKERLERQNRLPESLEVCADALAFF